jgi:hypothetical protein
MRYVIPARRTSSRSLSKVTRKKDVRDMTSQAMRNRMPSRATITTAMEATRRLKKKSVGASRRFPM